MKKRKTLSISGRAFLPEKLKNAFFHCNPSRKNFQEKTGR